MISTEQIARLASKISAPFMDRTLKSLASSERIDKLLKRLEFRRLQKIDELKRILIIPDINIGDAVIAQSFISPLKNSFPGLEIDYAYQRSAYPLIKENPHINRHFPIFRSLGFPSKKDCKRLKNIIEKYSFDLIFNFCPYLPPSIFKSADSSVIHPIRLTANIIRAYASNSDKAQIVFRLNQFANEMVEKLPYNTNPKPKSMFNFPSNRLYTNQQLWTSTKKTMERLKINRYQKKVLFNPDTASPYTLIPLKFQIELLKGILSNKELIVLMNCGFIFKGIQKRVLDEIPPPLRKRIIIIPRDTPIDVYAGLIDNSDMFISGDTGPLHIAAAKKVIVNSDNHFKNSTAIVGIYGATSPKIYGYDSFSDEYLPASQNAPSKSFEGSPPCKNLTCIDKIFKKCPEVMCFNGLDPESIIDYIQNYLS
jgi:ADP-heptose:LPS heptosyltransferase